MITVAMETRFVLENAPNTDVKKVMRDLTTLYILTLSVGTMIYVSLLPSQTVQTMHWAMKFLLYILSSGHNSVTTISRCLATGIFEDSQVSTKSLKTVLLFIVCNLTKSLEKRHCT